MTEHSVPEPRVSGEKEGRETCTGARRSRADWMGSDQSTTCPCVRPKGHAGPCACDHDDPADRIEEQS